MIILLSVMAYIAMAISYEEKSYPSFLIDHEIDEYVIKHHNISQDSLLSNGKPSSILLEFKKLVLHRNEEISYHKSEHLWPGIIIPEVKFYRALGSYYLQNINNESATEINRILVNWKNSFLLGLITKLLIYEELKKSLPNFKVNTSSFKRDLHSIVHGEYSSYKYYSENPSALLCFGSNLDRTSLMSKIFAKYHNDFIFENHSVYYKEIIDYSQSYNWKGIISVHNKVNKVLKAQSNSNKNLRICWSAWGIVFEKYSNLLLGGTSKI